MLVLKNISEIKLVTLIMGAWFIVLCLVAIFTNGTGDAGDSVQHYLFSKYAFKHPELFLDHWAKPIFVLLSAPFAQLGFVGMKIFNCLIAVLTGYFTYRTAKLLRIRYSLLVLVFLFFAPLYFILIFSGLTEPLFALVLILGIYLILRDKPMFAALVISLLPFVRSEGLIILGVVAFYFIVKHSYKYLPVLLSGHILYGIAGFIYYQDLLWTVNKIPYASMSSPYGSGEWYDFFIKMNYTVGIPLYLLLVLGIGFILITLFAGKIKNNESTYQHELILIYGSFVAVFVAHSVFWYFGIFNSMGLKRVLIGIMPVMAIIALNGYNLITHEKLTKPKMVNYALKFILAAYVIAFPFTPNPAAVNWEKELSLGGDQVIIDEIAEYVREDFADYKLYYSHPYISMALDLDHFDKTLHEDLISYNKGVDIPGESLIIWDNWFSVVENGVALENLKSYQQLKEIGSYETKENGRRIKIVVLKNESEED